MYNSSNNRSRRGGSNRSRGAPRSAFGLEYNFQPNPLSHSPDSVSSGFPDFRSRGLVQTQLFSSSDVGPSGFEVNQWPSSSSQIRFIPNLGTSTQNVLETFLEPAVAPSQLAISIDDLLLENGREKLPQLDPDPLYGHKWFDRGYDEVVFAVSKVFMDNFDGPYTSWNKLPPFFRDRWFISFAWKYNWNPTITGLVSQHFDIAFKRRIKDNMSRIKLGGEQPTWILDDVWTGLWAYWNTPKHKERSLKASRSRKSDRKGFGMHKLKFQ